MTNDERGRHCEPVRECPKARATFRAAIISRVKLRVLRAQRSAVRPAGHETTREAPRFSARSCRENLTLRVERAWLLRDARRSMRARLLPSAATDYFQCSSKNPASWMRPGHFAFAGTVMSTMAQSGSFGVWSLLFSSANSRKVWPLLRTT